MLVVCSDIHVLWSPLISVVVTRMQDLASEFKKFFSGGNTPGPRQREGRPPPASIPSLAFGWARAPLLGPKP